MCVSRTKWFMAIVTAVCLTTAASLPAQQGGQDRGGPGGRGGGGGGFGFGGGGALTLLLREEVREELELLDDQTKQLTELREKSTAKMRDLFTNARPGGDAGGADRREEMRETFRKFAEQTQADIDKILLPHQSKRLKQLEAQMRMRGGGVMGALGGDVAQQLGVSEDQQEKLREKARELEAEMRKKTSELRKQAQEQLLASLSAEQRAKFKEMVGEPFEFKDDGGPGGPGGFGGFGGFGGGGGPGGGGEGGGRRGAGGRPQNN